MEARAILRYARISPRKAVSYTHLRAHETVLDLVCRLLLEINVTTVSYTHLTLPTKRIV